MTPSLLHPKASINDLLEDETGNPLDAKEVLQDSMTEGLRLKYRLQRALKTGQGRCLCELEISRTCDIVRPIAVRSAREF